MDSFELYIFQRFERGEISSQEFVDDLILLVSKRNARRIEDQLKGDVVSALRNTVFGTSDISDIPDDFAASAKPKHVYGLKKDYLNGCRIWRDHFSLTSAGNKIA